jgi:hypothetical protein
MKTKKVIKNYDESKYFTPVYTVDAPVWFLKLINRADKLSNLALDAVGLSSEWVKNKNGEIDYRKLVFYLETQRKQSNFSPIVIRKASRLVEAGVSIANFAWSIWSVKNIDLEIKNEISFWEMRRDLEKEVLVGFRKNVNQEVSLLENLKQKIKNVLRF